MKLAICIPTILNRCPIVLRNYLIFRLFYDTGARLEEIASARMGDVYKEEGDRWWLDVVGKGNKRRRLPLKTELVALFHSYRKANHLVENCNRDDESPLILATKGQGDEGISGQAIYLSVKTIFLEVAIIAEAAGALDDAAMLRKASPHWLRHSMLTHCANNGVPLEILQATAGHASLTTTGHYLHVEDNDRHDALTKMRDVLPYS